MDQDFTLNMLAGGVDQNFIELLTHLEWGPVVNFHTVSAQDKPILFMWMVLSNFIP